MTTTTDSKVASARQEIGGLVKRLVEERRSVFSFATLLQLSGATTEGARKAVQDLLKLGVLRKVRADLAPDTFLLIPDRLQIDAERLDPPFLLAPLLTSGLDYFISHATAMEVHGMAPPQRPIFYVTLPRYAHNRVVGGSYIYFVRCRPQQFYGAVEHQADRWTRVLVSDRERTIIDGLRQPKYCGGFAAVVLAMQLRRRELDIDKLVDYALGREYDNLQRRLGYLLDLCRVDAPAAVARLHAHLDPESAYMPLDPTRTRRGVCCPRWRLHINFDLTAIEGAAGLSREDHLSLLR